MLGEFHYNCWALLGTSEYCWSKNLISNKGLLFSKFFVWISKQNQAHHVIISQCAIRLFSLWHNILNITVVSREGEGRRTLSQFPGDVDTRSGLYVIPRIPQINCLSNAVSLLEQCRTLCYSCYILGAIEIGLLLHLMQWWKTSNFMLQLVFFEKKAIWPNQSTRKTRLFSTLLPPGYPIVFKFYV